MYPRDAFAAKADAFLCLTADAPAARHRHAYRASLATVLF
jgi:hypothetical protein